MEPIDYGANAHNHVNEYVDAGTGLIICGSSPFRPESEATLGDGDDIEMELDDDQNDTDHTAKEEEDDDFLPAAVRQPSNRHANPTVTTRLRSRITNKTIATDSDDEEAVTSRRIRNAKRPVTYAESSSDDEQDTEIRSKIISLLYGLDNVETVTRLLTLPAVPASPTSVSKKSGFKPKKRASSRRIIMDSDDEMGVEKHTEPKPERLRRRRRSTVKQVSYNKAKEDDNDDDEEEYTAKLAFDGYGLVAGGRRSAAKKVTSYKEPSDDETEGEDAVDDDMDIGVQDEEAEEL